MDSTENGGAQTGMSRRKMLTGLGIGAAGAWAAPAVLSLGSAAAGAATSVPGCGLGFNCNPYENLSQCDNNSLCYCFSTTEGGTACLVAGGCDDACATSADCAPGFICAPNTCCGTPICQALCESPQAVVHSLATTQKPASITAPS